MTDTNPRGVKPRNPIGRHLATLNLFRESDGRIFITVAEGRGAMAEMQEERKLGIPADYVNECIRLAVENLP